MEPAKTLDFGKLVGVIGILRKAVADIIALLSAGTPPGAQAAVSEMQKGLVDADALLAECAAADTVEKQKALGDRIKNLIALLQKFLGSGGGLGNILTGILGGILGG